MIARRRWYFPERDREAALLSVLAQYLAVFRLTKCNLRQAGQETLSYSSSGTSSSSSSQCCWTFIDVAGHLKMKGAIRSPVYRGLGLSACLGVPGVPSTLSAKRRPN